jgi:oxygen-independent coproporphyrinogen-3 oxidase
MCDFRLDLDELQSEFGPRATSLAPILSGIAAKYGDFVHLTDQRLEISPEGRPLTRMIAAEFDQHVPDRLTYSRAS